MMAESSNSGDQLFIATGATANSVPANQAAWEALTWTEIGGVMEIGEYGDETNIISYKKLATGRVNKLTGTKDAGNSAVQMASDPLDAGQIALKAAAGTKLRSNFKRILKDAADANDPNSVHYFGAFPAGFKYGATSEGGDAVRSVSTTLAITTAVLEVPTVATP
jgi:Phage tail tube protein, TTP